MRNRTPGCMKKLGTSRLYGIWIWWSVMVLRDSGLQRRCSRRHSVAKGFDSHAFPAFRRPRHTSRWAILEISLRERMRRREGEMLRVAGCSSIRRDPAAGATESDLILKDDMHTFLPLDEQMDLLEKGAAEIIRASDLRE